MERKWSGSKRIDTYRSVRKSVYKPRKTSVGKSQGLNSHKTYGHVWKRIALTETYRGRIDTYQSVQICIETQFLFFVRIHTYWIRFIYALYALYTLFTLLYVIPGFLCVSEKRKEKCSGNIFENFVPALLGSTGFPIGVYTLFTYFWVSVRFSAFSKNVSG